MSSTEGFLGATGWALGAGGGRTGASGEGPRTGNGLLLGGTGETGSLGAAGLGLSVVESAWPRSVTLGVALGATGWALLQGPACVVNTPQKKEKERERQPTHIIDTI